MSEDADEVTDSSESNLGEAASSDQTAALDASSDSAVADGKTRTMLAEMLTLAVWTLVADLFIFRAQGYLAVAVFFVFAIAMLVTLYLLRRDANNASGDEASAPDGLRSVATWIAGAILVIAILRLGWAGSAATSLAAGFVLASLALSLSGWLPTLSRTLTLIFFSPFFGADRLRQLQRLPIANATSGQPGKWLAVLIPFAAVLLFGGIFVMANPDLVSQVSDWFSKLSGRVFDFFACVSFWELPFCILALFVGAGVLRPLVTGADELITRLFRVGELDSPTVENEQDEIATTWYQPFRNTLFALIALFVVYLVFEFKTLWGREFPEGFYYAGYAHEGAAWLTVALALATLTLSLIFHADIFRDPRVDRLKSLAWIWSAMNLLLAVAVYNRLSIYVGYNGMTRLRTVGFFGITLVLVGFLLVIFKILQRRSFTWLIQSQLLALSVTVVLYCVFPVDYLAHRYNASQVADGYLKPSVMIAVKPIDDEGVFPLLDLVDHPDKLIREGVRAMLAERQLAIESYSRDTPWHWHRYQYSKTCLYQRLASQQSKWKKHMRDPQSRELAISEFQNYAMQWY